MAGDFSRKSFYRSRHYSGVLMQQGRVLVDAEWNEQLAIQQHRTHAETRDVVGRCGTPKTEDGFLIQQTPHGDDFLIGPGRYYVDGLLCEVDATPVLISFPQGGGNQSVVVPYLFFDGAELAQGEWVCITADQNPTPLFTIVTQIQTATRTLSLDADVSAYKNAGTAYLRRAVSYTTQPYDPAPDLVLSSPPHSPSGASPVNLSDGDYLVYLEAWQREVNALEDPHIREVALDGPDTTERLQTVWQVKILPVSAQTSPPVSSPPIAQECCSDYPEWSKLIAQPTGMMNAQTVAPTTTAVCVLPPTAGYQRLENQLYRVEVFQGGDSLSESTYVWSRDNATLQTSIVGIDGSNVLVTSLGKDDYFSFADGQTVEIAYPESEFSGAPRFLATISGPPDTSGANPKLTLSSPPPAFSDVSKLRLIRWDMPGSAFTPTGIAMQSGWVDIEAGIQVQFNEGSYKTGDYWLIPARTATGEIEWPPFAVPNTNPVPQPPAGAAHHYCCLAHINVIGGIWAIHDCRAKFPPLTHICADDICYQGDCDLPGIDTVQDAIDQLCQQRDLRFHNRHLHGWGIVCGLKLTCGPDTTTPRRHVTVSSGYAIDCDGNDVLLNSDRQLDFLAMVEQLPPPPPTSPPEFPDGDYSLILDQSVPGGFRIEPYVAKSFWDSVLNDTLFLDIYNDCIKGLVDFYQSQFNPSPPSTELVGPGQRATTAVTNLVVQYSNPNVGGFVFLSGDSNQSVETPFHEDFILRDLYTKLRQELQSQTYCGMFDEARPFPGTDNSQVKYPYSGFRVTTIFGRDNKSRVRVDPTGRLAFTVGADAAIHVYDLGTQTMATITQFPDSGTTPGDVVVQDVAFSADGTQLFAIASIGNQHTMFALATISGTQIAWQKQILIANVVMSTLATFSASAGLVFAVGLGKGLYTIDVSAVFVNPNLTPSLSFNAFGHLVIEDSSGLTIATALSTAASGAPPDHFDQVLLLNARDIGTPTIYSLSQQGGQGNSDCDILISQTGTTLGDLRIAIVATLPSLTNKQLLVLNVSQFAQGAAVTPIGLVETAAVRLAYNQNTGFLMVSMESNYRVMLVDQSKLTLQADVFPVQIQPLSIAFHAKSNMVYVLNYTSKTLTAYSADLLAAGKQPDLNGLLAYRSAAINAFLDLLGGFLEYLKDCICQHLLVECPTCDEDDRLFLGAVSIRQGQVFKICNFSQRKYVKSFPTVGYWLSAIPIVPILRQVIETACCSALPDLFAKQSAPQPSSGSGLAGTLFNPEAFRGAVTFVQQAQFKNTALDSLSKIFPSQKVVNDFLINKAVSQPPVTGLSSNEVLGSDLNIAQNRLNSTGVNVANVVRYNPADVGQNLAGVTLAPDKLKPGDAVSLVVNDNNQVLYYTRSSPDVALLHTQVQANQQQLQQTNASLKEIAASSLQTRVTTLEAQVASQQTEVQASLDKMKETTATLSQLTATSQQLKDSLEAANKTLSTSQPTLDATKDLQARVDSLRAELASQKTAHDQALAERDQKIVELTKNTQALQKQLQLITTRLPGGPGGLK